MYNDPEWRSHNIWIALKLLKEFKILHWKEFLFTLHYIEIGKTIEESIEKIKENPAKIDNITFLKENGKVLPNTCYSYIRSFLEEAGLISKVSKFKSKLLEEGETFYSQIGM